MIPLIWNENNRQIDRNRKWISGCLGLEGWQEGGCAEFLFGVIKMFYKWLSWWLYNSVNILNGIGLYTLNGWIACYMNYISVKPFKKKRNNQTPKTEGHSNWSSLTNHLCLNFLKSVPTKRLLRLLHTSSDERLTTYHRQAILLWRSSGKKEVLPSGEPKHTPYHGVRMYGKLSDCVLFFKIKTNTFHSLSMY